MFKQIFALFYEEGFKVPKTHLTEHEILLLATPDSESEREFLFRSLLRHIPYGLRE